MISSGAAREKNNNSGYYNKLLQYSKMVPCPSEKQIMLDIRRTFPEEKKCMTEKFLEKLKNVLICYSIRNTSVGYCQGMNFIAGRILLIMGDEEQTFWIFIQIMEKYLSITYYSELVGIVIETTIIENLISFYFPKLSEFFLENNFNVPLRNFIHKWMVGLFTQTLSPEMVYTFFDFLLLDGSDLLINNSLFIISFIHDKLLENNSIEYMYNIFNEGLIKIHDVKTMIYFLCNHSFEITSTEIENYKKKLENSIISKIKEENVPNEEKINNRINALKEKGIICNPNWPTCFYDDYTQTIIDVLVLKQSNLPYIINDYYYVKNDSYPDNQLYEINQNSNKSSIIIKEVLVERHKHICDNAKLVDNSKLLIEDEYTKIDFDLINWEKFNQDENKIYDKLKHSKDFDNIVNDIKIEMEKIIKPIKINEINIIIENNEKGEKYYPNDYIFYILE